MNEDLQRLKYPIGEFSYDPETAASEIEKWIEVIASFPNKVQNALADIPEKMLDTPYRSGGWTVRQVVHHLADSHTNAFIRFPMALTEDNPTVKPYREELWAELKYQKSLPLSNSVHLLETLHFRWAAVLKSMSKADFARTYVHPEFGRQYTLLESLALYAWHCNHHLGHIMLVTKK